MLKNFRSIESYSNLPAKDTPGKNQKRWLLTAWPEEPALKVGVAMAMMGEMIHIDGTPTKKKPIIVQGNDIDAFYAWTAAILWSQKLGFSESGIQNRTYGQVNREEELVDGWFVKTYFKATSFYEKTFKHHLKEDMFIVGPFPQELKQILLGIEKSKEEAKKVKEQEARKQEEALKQDEARKQEAIRNQEEARKQEEISKQEAAKRQDEAIKQEAKKQEDEGKQKEILTLEAKSDIELVRATRKNAIKSTLFELSKPRNRAPYETLKEQHEEALRSRVLKQKFDSLLEEISRQSSLPSLVRFIALFKKEGGAYVNFQDAEGLTLLMHAISYQLDAFAEYLLVQENANPFFTAKNGSSAATMVPKSSPLYSLIWRAPRYEVGYPEVDLNAILLVLVKRMDVSLSEIKRLLILGASINCQDPEGFTPLMLAADAQNDRVVEYLLDNGANPLLQNLYKEIASDLVSTNSAMYSILKQKEKEYRMDSVLTNQEKYSIMLQEYVVNSDAKIQKIDEYIRLGADINYQNLEGNSALILAVGNQNESIVVYLLHQNANPLLRNKYHKKASDFTLRGTGIFQTIKEFELLYSVLRNDIPTVKSLLREDININFQGVDGYSALLLAVIHGFNDMVALLLINGADQAILSYEGEGVFDLVKDAEILKLLKAELTSVRSDREIVITPSGIKKGGEPKFFSPSTDTDNEICETTNPYPLN